MPDGLLVWVVAATVTIARRTASPAPSLITTTPSTRATWAKFARLRGCVRNSPSDDTARRVVALVRVVSAARPQPAANPADANVAVP
jgi:hypothetical protein